MAKDKEDILIEKLDVLIGLLRHTLVLQLAERGVTQQEIAKHIHASKSTVVQLLKGVPKDGG